MVTERELRQATCDFFHLFWNDVNGQPPEWSEHWNFRGTIPNHDKRGCYALFTGNEIVYIGCGLGKSSEPYIGCGLGDRLKNYWTVSKELKANQEYVPSTNWPTLTSIATIGFNETQFPIAASLEIYLIQKLKPIKNSTYNW